MPLERTRFYGWSNTVSLEREAVNKTAQNYDALLLGDKHSLFTDKCRSVLNDRILESESAIKAFDLSVDPLKKRQEPRILMMSKCSSDQVRIKVFDLYEDSFSKQWFGGFVIFTDCIVVLIFLYFIHFLEQE